MWEQQFALYYGKANETPIRGITWNEIDEIIESYIKVSKLYHLLYTINMSLESWKFSALPRVVDKS